MATFRISYLSPSNVLIREPLEYSDYAHARSAASVRLKQEGARLASIYQSSRDGRWTQVWSRVMGVGTIKCAYPSFNPHVRYFAKEPYRSIQCGNTCLTY